MAMLDGLTNGCIPPPPIPDEEEEDENCLDDLQKEALRLNLV